MNVLPDERKIEDPFVRGTLLTRAMIGRVPVALVEDGFMCARIRSLLPGLHTAPMDPRTQQKQCPTPRH